MNRLFILFIVFLCSFHLFAQTTIKAKYSPTANLFIIMDQVSNWWPGFTDEEYQIYWKSKFGLEEKDLKLFQEYKDLRWRYYNSEDQNEADPLKNRNGLFALQSSDSADPLANVFYSSGSLNEALEKLSKIITSNDLVFLKEFYKHFESSYRQLLKESEVFKKSVQRLNKGIQKPGISKFYNTVKSFYHVNEKVNYQVLYVWWPHKKRTLSTPSGQYLIMYYNPEAHKDMIDEDVVFHEIVHTISAKRPLEQKQQLSKLFLDICLIGSKLKRGVILEEPLAVSIGQIVFMEKFYPEKVNYGESLYNNPWISTFGKLITPLVREALLKGKYLDEPLITSFGNICSELVSASKMINKDN